MVQYKLNRKERKGRKEINFSALFAFFAVNLDL